MAKSLQEIWEKMEQDRLQKLENEKIEEQKIIKQNELAKQEWMRTIKMYESASSVASAAGAGGGGTKPQPLTVTITDFQPAGFQPQINSITIDVSGGVSEVTQRGFIYNLDPEPALGMSPSFVTIDEGTGTGTFTITDTEVDDSVLYHTTYLRAFATNNEGTVYSDAVSWMPELCLVKGTKVTLSDLTHKNIEDVEYTDELLVWNFDIANFSKSNPLWIKKSAVANKYNLLTFSDGTQLKTISQHRIFNKESGMFTYPMTDDSPIGTTTFNEFGEEVTLISKEIINDSVEYYNIITDKHINLFGNGILTSCNFNNIYPISDMKFIKDDRQLRTREEFSNISDSYFEGLRLSEQTLDLEYIETYITRLERYALSFEEAN